MKHPRSITTRSHFLVRFQKSPATQIFPQNHTHPPNPPHSPPSRIPHFPVVSVTNTPTPQSL